MQWWAGAFEAVFQGNGDEPAHFLSCLLVHDYIRAGLPGNPAQYAAEYYLHLPHFAVGYWPPLFYLIAALWMFVVGVSRAAALWLVAAASALLCLLIQRQVAQREGLAVSLPAGLMFALLPAVTWSNSLVMLDVTVALFGFLALLSWAGYLERGNWKYSVWFGIWASAAVLVKTSGAWVFLLFPAGLLVAHRDRLWRRGATWLPVAVAMCLCLPWFVFVRQMLLVGLPKRGGAMGVAIAERLVFFAWPTLQASFWPWLTLPALLWSLLRWPGLGYGRRLITLQPLVFLFALALSPVGPEPRYVTGILPALLVLLGTFLTDLSTQIGRRLKWWRPRPTSAIALLVLATFTLLPGHRASIPRIDPWLSQIVSRLMQDGDLRRHVVLVSSKGPSGDILVEAALQERQRPGTYLARSNKMLARMEWMGEDYRLTRDSTGAVLKALDENCVGAVLVATGRPEQEPHHTLLLETLTAHPERFRLISAIPESAPFYKLYAVQNACPSGISLFRKSVGDSLARKVNLPAALTD